MFLLDFKTFKLWIAHEVFNNDSEYFECLVSEIHSLYSAYVDIHLDNRFNYIKITSSSKERLDNLNREIEQVEWNSYLIRKSSSQPMWKLHRTTVESLVKCLIELNGED